MASNAKKLRSGYTTGACAAAAAKAAAMLLLQSTEHRAQSTDNKITATSSLTSDFLLLASEVDIPFPDGSRHTFKVLNSSLFTDHSSLIASASVIKDGGDDPDVTNRAEIVAEVSFNNSAASRVTRYEKKADDSSLLTPHPSLVIKGGRGVGTVTKPGLAVPVGEPAINPVPRRMIQEAVMEAIIQSPDNRGQNTDKKNLTSDFWLLSSGLEVTISVPKGEELAKKTLNARLGIIGGISILGTSGIVRPLSSEAWTSCITASMDVARALMLEEIVLSVGRISEKAHMKKYGLPEESYVMMGDYFEFSLLDARKHGFKKIHISAHWAKMLKISMSTPHTHVRHGAIDLKKGVEHLNQMGIGVPEDREFNTAREIYDYIVSAYPDAAALLKKICVAAKKYAQEITGGMTVITHLVSYEGDIILDSE